MHDDLGARPPSADHDPSARSARRPHRTSLRQATPVCEPSDAQLAAAVLTASNGARAVLDERYLLTAFVVHRAADDDTRLIVVELLDHGPSRGSERWQATAYDELSGAATQLGHGASAEQALHCLEWHALE